MDAYFVRGAGESWSVIRLTGRDREEVIADGLSRDAAIELCFQKLEELPRGCGGGRRAVVRRGHCATGPTLAAIDAQVLTLPRRGCDGVCFK